MPARQPVAADDSELDRLGELLVKLKPPELKAWVEQLEPADVEIVERALARVAATGWRAGPLSMGVHFGSLDQLAHTQYLSARFRDAVEGRSTRQIWNLPPQHGKSLIASRWGPAWALDREPDIRLGLTSYGDELARENAVAVRDILLEHGDELRVRLRRDVRRANRFLTPEGGGIIAGGVGSRLTGFGLHGVIVDDPFKDWQDAHSDAKRLRVWNWYRSTVRTRLNHRRGVPPFIILVMTRWHEEDLAGMLEALDESGEGEGFEIVRMPAIAEEDDILGRAPGEVLAPTLHDGEELHKLMLSIGSYLSAGLYQQRPAPEEGTEIMRGWWRWYDAPPKSFDAMLTSWDMKLKDTETGDFVVGQAWGRTGADYWCLDQLRGQWNQATVKVAIALMQHRHPEISRHVIENTGNAPEVMAELRRPQEGYTISEEIRSQLGMTAEEVEPTQAIIRRGMSGLLPETPRGKKSIRMRAQVGLIEGGNVHLPYRSGGWAESLVDESAAFGSASSAHDDQVDAMSQALKRLRTGTGVVTKTKPGKINKPKPGARATSASVRRPRGRYG